MDEREAFTRRRWLCRDPGAADLGPLTATDVIQALLDRKMSPDAELSEEGSNEWRPVRTIDQFRIATRAVRASAKHAPAPVRDEEEDIKTRVATAQETAEDDEEDVKTKYYGGPESQPAASARASQPDARLAAKPAPVSLLRPSAPASRPALRPPAPAARPSAPKPPARKPPAPPPAPKLQQPLAPSAPKLQQPAAPPVPSAPAGNEVDEDVRTRYYQPGGAGPMRLPSFKDLAAAEQQLVQEAEARASQPAPPQPAVEPPPQSSPQAQPAVLIAPSAIAQSAPVSEEPIPAPAAQPPAASAPQFAQAANPPAPAGPSPHAMALMAQLGRSPAPPPQGPEPDTRMRQRGALPQPSAQPGSLPWFRLALMAVIGALVGLILALGIAVLFKLAQR